MAAELSKRREPVGAILAARLAEIDQAIAKRKIVIEMHTDEAGERYPVAHATYRFERPDVTEAPIPMNWNPCSLACVAENCLIR